MYFAVVNDVHFLEIKKFQSKNVKEMNRMERWAAYFSPVTPEEEIAELAAEDEDIRAAVEVEKMFTQDEVARRKYELAEKFRRDQAAQLRFARDEGRKELLRGMFKAGIGIEQIALASSRTVQEVNALQQHFKTMGLL
ncbi:MAG: PD-(D/E)XK nuclease family transposase [Selenomonas sp.]|nr:PD-(D/E)XK nuclease family transposase [Selenomonas sp.]